ncbi:hypothetical protein PBAT_20505 [Paenibacillus antarcticus]|uniref:Uncharacterized protein n=1 Tax=Paenibacillus antarcticus TaxID=253703 RepID=A0A162K268_9BACL|nr:hypothetical protein PBAT_20505 [Paenibacillus antarcticus]
MSPLLLIGLIGLISAILQLKYPEIIFKLKLLGIRSLEAVKIGGYVGIFISLLIIICDIFIVR